MSSDDNKNEQQIQDHYQFHYFSSDIIGISTKTQLTRPRKYKRQEVRKFLQSPVLNFRQLQDISQYLKASSGNYFRIVKYLSGLLTFDYIIYPYINSKKFESEDRIKSTFESVAMYLGKMNLKYNLRNFTEKLIENGEIFIYKLEDNNSIIYKEIPSQFCRISMIEDDVCMYEINLSLFTDETILEYPIEFQDLYKDYKNNKLAKRSKNPNSMDSSYWGQVSNKGVALSLGYGQHWYPILCFIYDDIMMLEEQKDLYEDNTKLNSLKLIHQKMPLDKNENKPIFDKNMTDAFHNATKRNLPKGVSVTTNPFDISSVSFEKTVNNEYTALEKSERNVWNASGISNLLFNSEKASGEGLKKAIITDEMLVYPLLYIFANFINKELKSVSSTYRWKIKFLELTYNNRDATMKDYRESLAFGGSRQLFLSSCGLEPIEYVNTLKTEAILDLDKLLKPVQTSHTISGGGRPTAEDENRDLGEAGEITREYK